MMHSMTQDDTVRTTVALDAAVLVAARRLAQARSQSLGKVLSDLARLGLRSEAKPASRHGFPVFDVPADAPPLTLEQIKQDEDDE